MLSMTDLLIIPDVHGRRFWRDAVERYPDADTIFLGDYHDPYPREEITQDESLENFREIIEYARTHPNCHLLLGNHDLHYFCSFGSGCRLDYANSAVIHGLLYDNLHLFAVATHRQIGDKTVVFSHAPIMQGWIETVNETESVPLLVSRLNRLLDNIAMNPWQAEDMLSFISQYRGGFHPVGSPIWADMREIGEHELIRTADYCIFGHTQQYIPTITDRWANLDCRRAFLLSSDLSLRPVEESFNRRVDLCPSEEFGV